MKPTKECESGYVGDADLIGIATSTFSNVKILHRSIMSTSATAERYGHKWFIKSLPQGNTSTTANQRLLKEFEILTSLRHSGIVTATSLEEIEGLGLSIVMEWVEGENLDAYLKNKKPALKERQQLAFRIVQAVAYIHSRGIVHRDLKPANIMVRRNSNTPAIVDFGLADTDSYTLLKQPGGTEGYMSPETQAMHDAAASDDIYSLGIILKLLLPECKTVIQRCLMPESKRYVNGENLLKALRGYFSFRKNLWLGTVVLIFLGILTVMGFEIIGLHKVKDSDVANITATQSKRHQTELNRVIENGVSIVEAIFRVYDANQMHTLINEGSSVGSINETVIQTIASSLDNYFSGLGNTLSAEDLSFVKGEVQKEEQRLYNEWQNNVLYGEESNKESLSAH